MNNIANLFQLFTCFNNTRTIGFKLHIRNIKIFSSVTSDRLNETSRLKCFVCSLQSASVLCMDVGFSMSNSAPGEEPPFELAKKVIKKFVQRQVHLHVYTGMEEILKTMYK